MEQDIVYCAHRSVSGTSVKALVSRFNAMDEAVNTLDEQTLLIKVDEIEQILSRPMTDLSERFPRIPVTASMLYTHAQLRGRSSEQYDPMYQAIFPAPSRELFLHRLQLPYIARKKSMEGLHKGAVFFWDPLAPVPLLPQGHMRHRAVSYSSFLDLEEFMLFHHPLVGRNHYKGNQVYANFGYVQVNGKWVDPESEGALFDAYMGNPADSESNPELPDLQRSQQSGPRMLTDEEQDEFYKEYVEDVTDDVDGEGDPRLLRISSATFARWADGASLGDQYVERVMTPQAKRQRPPQSSGKIKSRPKPDHQFDMETGSPLSGIYRAESSPSLLDSPLGVDIAQTPNQFSYSCPQSLLRIQKDAYRLRNNGIAMPDPFVDSTASTPEVYTSERAYQELARSGDPKSGEDAYYKATDEILELREKSKQAIVDNYIGYDEARKAIEERQFLSKEVFFLKQKLAQVMEENPPSPLFEPRASPLPTPLHTPTPRRPHRSQYQRYIDEEIERENAAIHESSVMDERVRKDLEMMMGQIEELRAEKDRFLLIMGAEDTAYIPNLIPQRIEPVPRL